MASHGDAGYGTALIVGAGPGLSASLAGLFATEGMRVVVAARDTAKLGALVDETGAAAMECDAADAHSVAALFDRLDAAGLTPDAVVYNPSFRVRGPFLDLDPEAVRRTLEVTAFGAFLVAQQAVRRMLPKRHGAILFTGASASLKGYAQSAPFAMGKFALRGLAQSMARELSPQGIHVMHVVIDGGIRAAGAPPGDDSQLDPDAIARSYLDLLRQPRSAWAWELELRPWTERF